MRKELKAATRKLLAIADLKLGKLSSFQAIRRELKTTRTELKTTRTELKTTRTELKTTRTELETTRTELETTRTELKTTRTELETTRTELETTRTELETTRTELETTRTELETTRTELETTRAELETTRAELGTTRAELETPRAELKTTRTELETTRKLLAPSALSYSNQDVTDITPTTPPITQVFISEDDAQLGWQLQNCVQSVKRCFPGSCHKIYTNKEIEDFIIRHYDRDLLSDYRRLKPNAYKADLARLCIVYIEGGWYADISITWTTPLTVPNHIKLFAVRDLPRSGGSSWAVNNGIFYAEKNHPALMNGIETIQRNIRNNYYGLTPLCPTGPTLWGKAIATTAELSKTSFGNLVPLTPGYPNVNYCFIDESGTIFAFFKPTSSGGDGLSAFNINSSTYSELWHKRDIYISHD